jgi:hypothetical protein
MKLLPLSRGLFAEVDDADFTVLSGFTWFAVGKAPHVYARRNIRKADGTRGVLALSRHITGAPPGMVVDHKDRDTLNNQRGNLRVCTQSENRANSRNRSGKVLPKGVRFDGKKYVVVVSIQIGKFDTVAGAVAAFEKYSKDRFGEYAN